MNITKITFTGADDSIDPIELVNITKNYPHSLEWGILFSGTKQGFPRFPSKEWIKKLCEVSDGEIRLNLSAHLCGKLVRDLVINDDFTWIKEYGEVFYKFKRIQLNFHGQFHKQHPNFKTVLSSWPNHNFILQCDGPNDNDVFRLSMDGHCVPLFDTSGGAGISPEYWPMAWNRIYCGYAGGLGPDNIVQELKKINAVTMKQPFWIDMERKIRSEDDKNFDLKKVKSVLDQIGKLIKEG